MKNTKVNQGVIKKIAIALGDLNNRVIYVGGATVQLYINDPAADDVRPTKDLDISLSVASLIELEHLRQELINKGFVQNAEDSVICRFRFDDVKIDVMNTKAIGWAPANPWFAPGFASRESIDVGDQLIHILPVSYFLATKFSAYHNRGNSEPRFSHDFEDVVYILDNRLDIEEHLADAPEDLRQFLKSEFHSILQSKNKQEAIYANLFYETREERFSNLMNKIKFMVENL